MSSKLKLSDYQALLNSISLIYSQAQEETHLAVNRILVQAYWRIGKQIIHVEQKNELRARYGDHLLERLSEDLTVQYGKGFSKTNLTYMRQFYSAYPIRQAPDVLTWTHYQILSTIESPKKRSIYEKKAVKDGWSSRELNARLKKDAVVNIPAALLLDKSLQGGQEEGLPKKQSPLKLPFKRGKLYTYRVKIAPQISVPKNHLLIDFGFNVWREEPSALRHVKDNQVIELSGTGSKVRVVASARTRKDLYFYKAILERVVDGDTLLVNIYSRPGAWIRQRLRLNGIDAPELSTKAGVKTKKFLQDTLRNVPFIILQTNKIDMYHRYLANIFYLPDELDPHTVAAEGRFLNQELLDEGVVREWGNRDK